MVLEAEKSKIKVPTGFLSAESCSIYFQDGVQELVEWLKW
jgi:hypothetical protein